MQSYDRETAYVLKEDGRQATVITNKSASCKECGKAQAGICGKSGAGMVLTVHNAVGARQGDTVELGLSKKIYAKGMFITFILPVAALMLFSYAGHILSHILDIQWLDVAAGITALIISFIYFYKKIRVLDQSTELEITKVLRGRAEYVIGSSSEGVDYERAFHRS